MIYNFELAILRWFYGLDDRIQRMIYAPDEDLLTSIDKAKLYPTLYYSRKEFELNWNKPLRIPAVWGKTPQDQFGSYDVYPYTQNYVGSIIVEGQREAFALATKLKYWFNKQPYVYLKVDEICPDYEFRVALFLDQISVEDIRRPNDLNGSCRMVRFSWHCQLVTVPDSEDKPKQPLPFVTQVRIWVDTDGSVKTIFEENPDVAPEAPWTPYPVPIIPLKRED